VTWDVPNSWEENMKMYFCEHRCKQWNTLVPWYQPQVSSPHTSPHRRFSGIGKNLLQAVKVVGSVVKEVLEITEEVEKIKDET
jgi:hypothetical protein